ncbi:18600_t:CDS:2, partial [Gigaspora rosea]
IGRLSMSEEINDRESALCAFKKALEDIDIIPSSVNSDIMPYVQDSHSYANQLRTQLLKNTWVRFLLPRNYPPLRHSSVFETVLRRIEPSGRFNSGVVASHHVHLQHATWTGLEELLLDTYDATRRKSKSLDEINTFNNQH